VVALRVWIAVAQGYLVAGIGVGCAGNALRPRWVGTVLHWRRRCAVTHAEAGSTSTMEDRTTTSTFGGSARVRWSLLAVTGTVLLGGALVLGLDRLPLTPWTWIAIGGSVLGGALVLATALAWRGTTLGPGLVAAVLLLGAAFRLAVIPAQQFLSDDALRYHWDGKVLWHGINPYRYAPADPALDPLRTAPLDACLVRPELRTVYPPLAQLFFALGYALSPGRLVGLQGLMLCCEVLAWLLLLRELRRRGLSLAHILLIAWSPLLVFQGYLPGHVDMLMLPFIALFVVALERGSPLAAGTALALACLIKPHAVIFAPAALRQFGVRRGTFFGLVFVGIFGGAYLPFLSPGLSVFSSVGMMARHWAFNGSLTALLRLVLARDPAREVAAALLVLLLVVSAWRGRDNTSRLLLAATAFIVCTPNLFPWYLFLMMPLLVLRPDPALLALSVLIAITETVTLDLRLTGLWRQPFWQRLVEYVPFYALLAVSAWRRWGMFGRDTAR
jgi:alpha-1,6-mannosyltransferase